MELQKWIDRVEKNKELLRELILNYHPASTHTPVTITDLPITAPAAEEACCAFRKQIKAASTNLPPPTKMFDDALIKQHAPTIYTLLNTTWMGVPESTSCRRIPGFTLMCDLLEDPPHMPFERVEG